MGYNASMITPKSYRIEVFNSNGYWYFHILARNGKIVAPSEGYSRRGSALKTASQIGGGRWPVFIKDKFDKLTLYSAPVVN